MPPKKKASKPNKAEDAIESKSDARIKALEDENTNLEIQITLLRDKLRKARDERTYHQQDADSIQAKFYTAKQDYANIVAHQRQELDVNKTQISDFEQLIQSLYDRMAEKEAQISELQEVNQKNACRLNECDSVIEDRQKLEQLVKSQQATMDKQSKEIERLTDEQTTLIDQCRKDGERLADLELKADDKTDLCIRFQDICIISRKDRLTEGDKPTHTPFNNLISINGTSHDNERITTVSALGEKLIWCEASNDSLSIHSMDLTQLTWTSQQMIADGFRSRRGQSASLFGKSKIIFYGGLDGHTHYTAVSMLNTESMTLQNIDLCQSLAPKGRCGHASCMVRNGLFIFGGRTEDELVNELWLLDTEHREWSQLICSGDEPSPREGASIVVSEDSRRLYLFGGFDGVECLNDFYSLDVERRVWTTIQAGGIRPRKRCNAVGTVVLRYFVVGSGKTKDSEDNGWKNLGDLYAFDFASNAWETLSSGSWISDYPWMQPDVQYSTFNGNSLIALKPDEYGSLSKISTVEFLLPEHIATMRSLRKKSAHAQFKLEITRIASVAHSIEIEWKPPSKNIDRIEYYKLMIATPTGHVTSAYEGRKCTCSISRLRPSTAYSLCVKAVYDDGSFVWSDAVSHQTPNVS